MKSKVKKYKAKRVVREYTEFKSKPRDPIT